MQVVKQLTGKEPFDKLRYGVANTALVKHNGKILALEETCLPFEIKVVDSEDGPFSVESVGYEDFEGALAHQCSAHPKLDQKTGELMVFGYDVAKKPWLQYSIFDKDGKLKNYQKIELRGPVMIHDFAVTQNYVIFDDCPMEFDLKRPLFFDQ